MNTKHTPGPWLINPYRDEYEGFSIYTHTRGVCLATVNVVPENELGIDYDFEVQKANADLIAAAPELLAGVNKAIDHINKWSTSDKENLAVIEELCELVKKATGSYFR